MRKLLLIFLLLCLFANPAAAADLPEDLVQAAPEAAVLAEEDLLSGAQALLFQALEGVRDSLFSGVRAVGAIMAGVVLLGVVECAFPLGKETRYVGAAGALWVTAASAGDLAALMGLGRETVGELSLLGKTLLPALAAAEAASGGITAAASRQVAAVFFADVLLRLIEGLLLPMTYLYIGTAAAGAVLEGDVMDRVGDLLKKCVGWLLSGLLILFTGYLAMSGAIAGAADAQAVKLAKSAVSTAIPVVGGILSDAAEGVLAGAGMLRGAIGTFGTLAVLGVCLLPVLRLGCQYLLYQGASLVAAAAGPGKLAKLLARLADAFALVLAMTAASAVLLLVAVISSVTAVLPG